MGISASKPEGAFGSFVAETEGAASAGGGGLDSTAEDGQSLEARMASSDEIAAIAAVRRFRAFLRAAYSRTDGASLLLLRLFSANFRSGVSRFFLNSAREIPERWN